MKSPQRAWSLKSRLHSKKSLKRQGYAGRGQRGPVSEPRAPAPPAGRLPRESTEGAAAQEGRSPRARRRMGSEGAFRGRNVVSLTLCNKLFIPLSESKLFFLSWSLYINNSPLLFHLRYQCLLLSLYPTCCLGLC